MAQRARREGQKLWFLSMWVSETSANSCSVAVVFHVAAVFGLAFFLKFCRKYFFPFPFFISHFFFSTSCMYVDYLFAFLNK